MTEVRIDSADFERGSDPEAAAFNATVIGGMKAIGWAFPPKSAPALREALAAGGQQIYLSPKAESLRVPSEAGGVDVRVFRAERPTAVFVHCHGGGFVIGSAAAQDARLEHIAEATGMTVVSVDFRLAPEHPYPAPLDDCEAVVRWLLDEGPTQFGTDRILIGGESAGANLALCALLRVNRTHPGRVSAASLLYGNFDLGDTPSPLLAGDDVMISKDALAWFYDQYVPAGTSRRDPDISPLYADLRGLPPVLVAVGGVDSLVDDSLFLAVRLTAAGVDCELHVVPGGDHAFDAAPYPRAREGVAVIDDFLARHAAKR